MKHPVIEQHFLLTDCRSTGPLPTDRPPPSLSMGRNGRPELEPDPRPGRNLQPHVPMLEHESQPQTLVHRPLPKTPQDDRPQQLHRPPEAVTDGGVKVLQAVV